MLNWWEGIEKKLLARHLIGIHPVPPGMNLVSTKSEIFETNIFP